MLKFKLLFITGTFIMVTLACSCAPRFRVPPGPLTEEEVIHRSRTEFDQGKKTDKLIGPWIAFSTRQGTGKYLLRALWKDEAAVYQVYVIHESGTWVFLTRAHDRNNNRKLEFIEIDRVITSGNSAQEDFAVQLERQYLDDASDWGIRLRAVGRKGEIDLDIPPDYIRGFLRKYDSLKKSGE